MHGRDSDGFVTPSAARSRNMAAVKRADTKSEVELRSALHVNGHRFRKDFALRVGGRLVRPDIVFTKVRVAVFVDGCFWHMCPRHGTMPATNVTFWRTKLEGNASRDREQARLLTDAGWLVVRIWEHEPLADAVLMVQRAIESRRQSPVI
jgi:DNA mismatch endonuclease, patch repair protein